MRLLLAVASVAGLLFALTGCEKIQYKVVADLRSPVFAEESIPPRPQPEPYKPVAKTVAGNSIDPFKPPPAKADPPVQPLGVRPADPAWADHARDNNWQYIIIHHSATPNGNAAAFDKEHREVRHWDELGYHFVIGNGTGSRDGQVEIGSRWVKQKHGAHCKTKDERYNDFGIGICLVGDFEKTRPTAAQLASLQTLVGYLMERYSIPATRVLGHGEAVALLHEGGTKCPGRNFDLDLFRHAVKSIRWAVRP